MRRGWYRNSRERCIEGIRFRAIDLWIWHGLLWLWSTRYLLTIWSLWLWSFPLELIKLHLFSFRYPSTKSSGTKTMWASRTYFNSWIAANVCCLTHGMTFGVRVEIIDLIFHMVITQFLNVILILLLLTLKLFKAIYYELFILLFLLLILFFF